MRSFFRRKFVQDTLTLQISKIGTTGLSVLSSILVVRLLGIDNYGTWTLVQSFLAVWQSFDLTGVSLSTSTRLGIASGAGDTDEILNLLGFYVQIVVLWSLVLVSAMVVVGPGIAASAYPDGTAMLIRKLPPGEFWRIAASIYPGGAAIGWLAAWLSLTALADDLYNMVMISLQTRRLMRTFALLQNLNQLALVLCTITALVISPTPTGMVMGRLVYSYTTMLLAFGFYWRVRTKGEVVYPTLRAILARACTVSPRPYWRFGVLNALDKNLSGLYSNLPLQLAGILGGPTAAGYLGLGLRAMTLPSMFTSAIFENLQAAVPRAIGRGDYATLWRNFLRVLAVLMLAAVGFYVLFALVTPLLVPLLYGAEWTVAVPVVIVLCGYGAITTVGGIFGPLYRALNLLIPAILVKVITLSLLFVPGLLLVEQSGALGGAWMVDGLFALSVILTAVVALPVLRRQAQAQVMLTRVQDS